MPTMTKEERLADIRQRIDDLEARARNSPGETKAGLQRRFGARRRCRGGARGHRRKDHRPNRGSWTSRLASTAREARGSGAVQRRESFADAVEAELDGWDAAIERMQARAAAKAYSTRDQAETSVAELRKARNRVAERLTEARSSTGEAWEEHKKHVTAALDDLERRRASDGEVQRREAMTDQAAKSDRPTLESAIDEGERMFSRVWKFIAAEGILAIAFGTALIIWPDIGLSASSGSSACTRSSAAW